MTKTQQPELPALPDCLLGFGTIDKLDARCLLQEYAQAAVLADRERREPHIQAAIEVAVARALLAAHQPPKRVPEEIALMPDDWSVTVQVEAETVLSIGHNWVSGANDFDENVILGAAKHLLSFIGYGLPDASFVPPEMIAAAPSKVEDKKP